MPRICDLTKEELREHEARRFRRQNDIEFERDNDRWGLITALACAGIPLVICGVALLQDYVENHGKENLVKHNALPEIYQPYDRNKSGILEPKEADQFLRFYDSENK